MSKYLIHFSGETSTLAKVSHSLYFNLTADCENDELLYDFSFSQKHWESGTDMHRHSFPLIQNQIPLPFHLKATQTDLSSTLKAIQIQAALSKGRKWHCATEHLLFYIVLESFQVFAAEYTALYSMLAMLIDAKPLRQALWV